MKNVLVVGCNGGMGAAICANLMQKGYIITEKGKNVIKIMKRIESLDGGNNNG